MALTAREWILLPKNEQKKRGKELSPEECFKLRMELSEVCFTEEEKAQMTEEQKYNFTHPQEVSGEKQKRNSQNTFRFLQNSGLLPKELTWEVWKKRGCPLS